MIAMIIVLEMCLLGMILAQWQKTGDLITVFEQIIDNLFYFFQKHVMIYL